MFRVFSDMSYPMFTVDALLEKHYPKISNHRWLSKPTCFFLRYILKEKEINNFSNKYPHLHGIDFVEQILEHFHFSYSTRDTEKENIPSEGKLVIIANNPIGSLDGLAIIKLVSEVRRDLKVVASERSMSITPLHSLFLPMNIADENTYQKQQDNIQAHLQNEGTLIIFPAGEVSRLKPQGVRDSRWKSEFLQIAANAKAPILPVFIDGKNSPLFYTLSMIYKPLATLLLVREMFQQRTKHLPMRVGELIPYDSYNNISISSHQKVKLLQKHLYRLGQNRRVIFTTQKAIAPSEDRKALSKAMRQCEHLGNTSDGKDIYLYRYENSSPILREIGRLREIAFRAVGEGTNRRRDIDQYDNEYYHLILWDKNDLEIVGAYRFGDAKLLTQEKNKLYSATLFEYSEKMQPYFEQGLELGRSFIQPKYWGKRSLDYLWYGIGAFLKHRPQYRYLFGPVSLSDALPSTAKDLLVCFYQLYFSSTEALAISNTPYQVPQSIHGIFNGDNYKEDFSTLKSMMSNMGVAIPTLYKQYTELFEDDGVHFLSFGIDPDFNNCVDGLVITDLHKLKEKRRIRYMSQ